MFFKLAHISTEGLHSINLVKLRAQNRLRSPHWSPVRAILLGQNGGRFEFEFDRKTIFRTKRSWIPTLTQQYTYRCFSGGTIHMDHPSQPPWYNSTRTFSSRVLWDLCNRRRQTFQNKSPLVHLLSRIITGQRHEKQTSKRTNRQKTNDCMSEWNNGCTNVRKNQRAKKKANE